MIRTLAEIIAAFAFFALIVELIALMSFGQMVLEAVPK